MFSINHAVQFRHSSGNGGNLSEIQVSRCHSRTNPTGHAWVAQLVESPTSAQVMILQFTSLSLTLGSVLRAQSLEPASDSVSPTPSPSSRSFFLFLSLSLSLSLSLKNKQTLKKRRRTNPTNRPLGIAVSALLC